MMKRDLVAGVDSSTQSTTVVLRHRDDGAVVGEARALHPTTTPPVSEQDPRAWWHAFEAAAATLGDDLKRVAAISVGGQGHGLVMLDEDDAPLRPAKLWNDTESAPDARRLCASIPPAEWAQRTGCVPGPALTVSKLAWTERCHPGLVGRASRIMLPSDYIVYRLCRRAVAERGGLSGTGYFNPFINEWEPDLAAAAIGFDLSERVPEIVPSSAAAGEVKEGALAGAVVGAGTGDNMTAALCLGVRDGDIVISIGTSGTVYAVTPVAVRDPSGAIDGYADASDRFMPMVTTLNAAKVTDTFRRLLNVTPSWFDDLALACPPAEPRPVLVPWLDGERTPDLPDARGTLHGLRTDVRREGFACAVVEGVICGLLQGLDHLRAHGVADHGRLILTGGAARSRAYRQLLADLAGRPVHLSRAVEAAAAGAAVQAEAALGERPLDEIVEAWAPPMDVVAEPRDDGRAEVRQRYDDAALICQRQQEGG